MKRVSEHTIEASQRELAEALGYDGNVTSVHPEGNAPAYLIKVIGDAKPPAPTGPPPSNVGMREEPVAPPAPAPAPEPAPKGGAAITIMFETTGEMAMLHAYLAGLKEEIGALLAKHPEPDVTPKLFVKFG